MADIAVEGTTIGTFVIEKKQGSVGFERRTDAMVCRENIGLCIFCRIVDRNRTEIPALDHDPANAVLHGPPAVSDGAIHILIARFCHDAHGSSLVHIFQNSQKIVVDSRDYKIVNTGAMFRNLILNGEFVSRKRGNRKNP